MSSVLGLSGFDLRCRCPVVVVVVVVIVVVVFVSLHREGSGWRTVGQIRVVSKGLALGSRARDRPTPAFRSHLPLPPVQQQFWHGETTAVRPTNTGAGRSVENRNRHSFLLRSMADEAFSWHCLTG
jgi:hypothetical protein